MKDNDKKSSVFTPEQKAAIMKALDDPEMLQKIIAILKDAGQLRE